MISQFQNQRLLQLISPLAVDDLLLFKFSASESISSNFQFRLEMVSNILTIDPKSILNRAFSILIFTGSNQPSRYFHGIASSFLAGYVDNQVRFYTAELCPWLWFLNFRHNSRIFQNKNVPDMVEQIFREAGYRDYDFSNVQRSQYKTRDYCVQYRESDYHFVQRLLEEEGIFYYFKHQQDKHILVLADQNTGFKTLDPNEVEWDAGSGKGHCITSWHQNNQVYSGKVTYQDYNFETPDNSLLSSQSSTAQLYAAQQWETYLYPAGHSDESEGKTRAQIQFQAQEVGYHSYRGSGNYPQFMAGGNFHFQQPPSSSDEGNYLLLSVSHQVMDGSYLHGVSGSQSYQNTFICIPAKVTYRPLMSVTQPLISSIQTATVVGSSGQEIDTDQYGRVKVQFHWDRQGKNDEDSSGWIRVAQMWAGNEWGAHFMPRVGQEVVVQFIEGNPDRPLIVGCVYNDNNQTPYSLPGSQTQSGIKTRSVGGGKDSYNELRFEDKNGAEEVYLQAQRDFNQVVKNNLTKNVGNNLNHSVKNNSNSSVGNNYTHSVGNNAKFNVNQDHYQTIGNNSTLSIGRSLSQNIATDAFVNVGNNLNQTANNSIISVGNNATHTVSNNSTNNIGNNLEQSVGGSSMVNIGSSGIFQAGESLTFKVGGTSLLINSQGIFLNGMQVKVNGQ